MRRSSGFSIGSAGTGMLLLLVAMIFSGCGDQESAELEFNQATPPMFDFSEEPRSTEAAHEARKAWADYLGQEIEITNSLGMKLALIPPGTYMRGSSADEQGRDHERPQHRVVLTRPFRMATVEVTQGQWKAVMGESNNPSNLRGDALPVEMVNWNEAVEFCRRLTLLEREAGRIGGEQNYRLPTEAEWEYTVRAGTTTSYYAGDDEEALGQAGWYFGNVNGGGTHRGGGKMPNAWGLFDMHGNVWEWCSDWYGPYTDDRLTDPQGPDSGEARVIRGGSWGDLGNNARSAYRGLAQPEFQGDLIGFRVLLSLDPD